MATSRRNLPTNPERVEAFANFFKRYMSISTVVVAALPIPVTAFQLIPTLPFQTQELSVYTPLFCFLVLAFIFYSRHALARWMFAAYFILSRKAREFVLVSTAAGPSSAAYLSSLPPGERERVEAREEREENERREQLTAEEAWWSRRLHRAHLKEVVIGALPLPLIVASLACVLIYRRVLNHVVYGGATQEQQSVLASLTPNDVRGSDQMILMMLYLGVFIFAEAAFVLMAIKEYLQDYLGLEDSALIDESALRNDIERSAL